MDLYQQLSKYKPLGPLNDPFSWRPLSFQRFCESKTILVIMVIRRLHLLFFILSQIYSGIFHFMMCGITTDWILSRYDEGATFCEA